MKKILYTVLATLSISCTFIACDSDDDNVRHFATTPEIDAKGVYVGTLTRVQSGTTDTTTAVGTMTIAPTDSAYVADITFDCEDFNLSTTVTSNITHANDGYVFSNNSITNAFQNPFAGRINDRREAVAHFTLKQRSGRKTVTYTFSFEGAISQE